MLSEMMSISISGQTPLPDGKGYLFVLVGPSGVGKNTVMSEVMRLEPALRQLPTVTTRPPREGEQEGIHHYFVSKPAFLEMIADDLLLEHQEVHPGKFYGVPRDQTGQALAAGQLMIADIDIFGARAVKQAFPDQVVTIFVRPPSVDVLRQRLMERDEKELEIRLMRATMELSHADDYDYQVINDQLDRCVQDVLEIIRAMIQVG
jgi:guanylate kinase